MTQDEIEKAYSSLWQNGVREIFYRNESGDIVGKWETLVDGEWVDYNEEFDRKVGILIR